MKTAKFIRSLDDWKGDAGLYKLSESVTGVYMGTNGEWLDAETEYVIVSGICNEWTHEVLVFAACEDGEVINYRELIGLHYTTSHSKVLSALGFEIE